MYLNYSASTNIITVPLTGETSELELGPNDSRTNHSRCDAERLAGRVSISYAT